MPISNLENLILGFRAFNELNFDILGIGKSNSRNCTWGNQLLEFRTSGNRIRDIGMLRRIYNIRVFTLHLHLVKAAVYDSLFTI